MNDKEKLEALPQLWKPLSVFLRAKACRKGEEEADRNAPRGSWLCSSMYKSNDKLTSVGSD